MQKHTDLFANVVYDYINLTVCRMNDSEKRMNEN